MKAKWKPIAIFAMLSVILSGCLQSLEQELDEDEIKPGEVSVQTTTNQLSPDFYRSAIVDGRYQLGVAASSDSNLSASGNRHAFEDGLLRISKEIFPTDQYFMHEGQIIDEETMNQWIARESEDNPEGLNPQLTDDEKETNQPDEQEESVDPSDEPEGNEEEAQAQEQEENRQVRVDNDSTPIYLAQIMEKNIMIETEEGFSLGGILIGLAMNSEYTYTDSDGVVYKQTISIGEMRERGKAFANIIAGRIRNTPELRSVPIVFGVYRMAPNDEVTGGTYILDGISREGNHVTDWYEHNEYRVLLPQSPESQEQDHYAFFDDFVDQVNDFFPNLNGISGEALFIENGLASLEIEVVSQFYQTTEITALTQHILDVAQRTLPEEVLIEINVLAANGEQAYVGKPAGSSQYQSHVFMK